MKLQLGDPENPEPSCEEWQKGWRDEFLKGCFEHRSDTNPTWDFNTNPCNCNTYFDCGGEWISQSCPTTNTIFDPCQQACLPPNQVDCDDLIVACDCFDPKPHCPWEPPTTTTTTTTTSATTTITTTAATTSTIGWLNSTTTSPVPGGGGGDGETTWWYWVLIAVIGLAFLIVLLVFLAWRRKRRWGKSPDRHHTPWPLYILSVCCLPFCALKSNIKRELHNREEEEMSSTSSSRFSSDKSNGDKFSNSNGKSNGDKFSNSNGGKQLTSRPSPRLTPRPSPSLEPSPSTRRRHSNKSVKYRNTNIFPMDLLDMGQTLGKGAYGKVYKGRLKLGTNLRVEVAVKTSTRSTGTEDLEREARVFMKLPARHLNIVNLMGVCLPTEADMHPLLLLELCEGNLEKLLQKNREDFLPPDTKHLKIISESGQLNSKLLVKYSYQVSRGMEFLEQHKIVHGDLAARNILLAQKGTVAKVSDFGLSHSLYTSVEELNNTSAGLPVRWMAPEVLMNRQVNNKSDIWSFGVLLWEVFSLGAVPYPEIPQIDLQFIQDLNDGLRYLGSPLYKVVRVQEDLDAVRLSTLKVAQEERPSFEQLSPRLWLVLEEASKNDYTQLEDDYKRYITLVEDSYEKMMAAKNSRRAPERAKDKGTARRAQKSGRGKESGMFRQVSHI